MSDHVEQHRWVVDAIDELVASIEVDGGQVVNVPRWLLPVRAREGQVLSVRHDRPTDGARSVLTVEIDEQATAQALRESAAQVQKGVRRSNDPGGDIIL